MAEGVSAVGVMRERWWMGGDGVLMASGDAASPLPHSPAPLLDHLRLLDDVFSLLVFLALLEGLLVLPAQDLLAARAVNISDRVKPGDEKPVLLGTEGHVHDVVEEVSAAVATLEGLGHDLVVVARVTPAVAARVYSRSVQVLLEKTSHACLPALARRSERAIPRSDASGRGLGSAWRLWHPFYLSRSLSEGGKSERAGVPLRGRARSSLMRESFDPPGTIARCAATFSLAAALRVLAPSSTPPLDSRRRRPLGAWVGRPLESSKLLLASGPLCLA